MPEFSAIVLAGGRGARMGRPKAGLRFGGAALIARVVGELKGGFEDIVVVAEPRGLGDVGEGLAGASVICDEREYEGPLPALARGLGGIRNEMAFACSCDVPFLRAEVAWRLCSMLGDYDAVIPEIEGVGQVLHAVYRRGCVEAIEGMIAAGERRLRKIAQVVSAQIVGEAELRKIDPELRSFVNVNTPEEYERALRWLEESEQKD